MPLISSHVWTMGPRAGGVIWESSGTFRRLSLLKEVCYWEKVLRLYFLVTHSFSPSWEWLQCDHKRNSPWYIIINKLKVQSTEQERTLKALRKKDQITYKTRPIRRIPDFSMETRIARRAWMNVLQTLRNTDASPDYYHVP